MIKILKNKKIYIGLVLLLVIIAGGALAYSQFFNNPKELPLYLQVNLTEEQKKGLQERIAKNMEMLKLFPDNYEVYLDLGNIEAELGNASKAIEYFTRAWEIIPNNSTPWLNIGFLYVRLTIYEKAEEAYLKAKNINKTYYKVYTDLAELYENYLPAKANQIRGLYLEGLKYTNNDFQVLYSFTEYLIRQKNYSEALQYLQVLLEKTPQAERQPVLDRIKQVEEM